MKPKPKKTSTPKRKPAAIVVGRNKSDSIIIGRGRLGLIKDDGFYGDQSDTYVFVGSSFAESMNVNKLKPGQYIRFVQDGGVRKARRVK